MPKPEREYGALAATWRAGNDIHPGTHLPAEIAVGAFLHVVREVRANAVPFLVDNPEFLELTHGGVDTLSGTFQKRLVLRMLQRSSEGSRHLT